MFLFLPWGKRGEFFECEQLREFIIGRKATAGDFPGGPAVKNQPASAGDMGLIPNLERSHMSSGP